MPFRYEAQLAALRAALQVEDPAVTFRPASASDLAYLERLGAPEAVLEFYRVAEPSEVIDLWDACFEPISGIRTENIDAVGGDIIQPLGYIVIGATLCGDAFCLDLPGPNQPDGPAVLVASHDEIEEGVTKEEARAKMVPVAASFGEFLSKLAAGELPDSYYDVREDGESSTEE